MPPTNLHDEVLRGFTLHLVLCDVLLPPHELPLDELQLIWRCTKQYVMHTISTLALPSPSLDLFALHGCMQRTHDIMVYLSKCFVFCSTLHQRRKRLKRPGWMLLWALKDFGVKGGSYMMAQLLCFLLTLLLKAMHITLAKQIMD